MNRLRLVSLFSGIGAFEKALRNIGIPYELVGFSEIDKWAITSYTTVHNVSRELNHGDVRDVDGRKFKDIDLLTHGSPCQSFSNANRHSLVKGGDKDSGTVSSLMWETIRIVGECKPKVVIWENVKSVLNKNNKKNFDKYIEELDKLGYKSFYKVMNSNEYGVAQSRERIFVVSLLDGRNFEFPKTVKLDKTLRDYLEEKVDEKYIVPTKMLLNYAREDNGFVGRINVRPLDTFATCLIAKGGRRSRTNNYVFYDFSMYEDESLDYSDINGLVDKGIDIRALTPLEYWRLQTFDDEDFYKAKKKLNEVHYKGKDKSDNQLYAQAGNSITVKLLEDIFKNLYIND